MTIPMPTPPTLRVIFTDGARLVGRFIRRHPVAFAIGVFGAANFAAAIVASAVVVGRLTDQVIVPVLDGGESPGAGVRAAVLSLILIAVWKTVGIVVRRSGATWMQTRSQADMRASMVEHLLQLELGWFRSQSTGDLISVSDSDASQSTYVLGPFPYATGAFLLLVGSMVIIVATDPILGLVSIVGLLAKVVFLDVQGSWRIFSQFEVVQERRGEVSSVAHESIDGALTVKALGREAFEVDRFRHQSELLRDDYVKVARTFTLYDSLQDAIPAFTTIAVLLIGAIRVSSGDLTAGELLRVTYLLSLVAFPLRLIGFLLWEVSGSLAAWNRVKAVLDVDDVVEYGGLVAVTDPTGASVDSTRVSYGYTADSPVIEDVDLEIPAESTVAVVGATGSGKSTLVTLMARLWDPSTGHVKLDGRDLRSFGRSQLAGEVAFVGQDVFLFDDTIANNIGFGLDVSTEEIESAARLAGAHDFILELPDGYDTRIGERGASLSGGQRQRVALARALVRRPRLLILDDATSAVDPSVESEILGRLRRADLPSTVVIVAYRRSSIALADHVIYLEGGRVLGQGSPEALLGTVPGYARLIQAYELDSADREAS